MGNVGIYREPGAAGGLPLPRVGLMPLTIVVALYALVALAFPPMLLAVVGRSLAGAWRLFKEGGLSMWLILLLGLLVPVTVAVLGAFVLRGKRAPSALLFGGAALPFGVALFGAWLGLRLVMGALLGESVDPEQKARILAEGMAESMACDIFGGFVVCGTAMVAAAGAASALASIDVAMITRGGPKPSSSGAVGAGAAGALWIVATTVIGVVRLRDAGGLALWPVLPVICVVPFAVLAGRGAPALRAWHDRAEASRNAAALLVAALSAVLALLALQRGIESSFTARALGAISGESVDPSQRARILASAIEATRLAPAAYAIHAVLGSATFVLALVPALGDGRHPMTASAAIAGAIAVVLLGSTFALARSRTAAPRDLMAQRATPPGGVTLPLVVEAFSDKSSGSAGGERMVITKDGTGEGDLSKTTSCSVRLRATIHADRAATLAMVLARLPRTQGETCSTQVTFVATRNHPPDIEKRLGDYAGLLGTTAYFSAVVEDPSTTSHGDELRVRSVADDAVEIDGVRTTLPPAGETSRSTDFASGSGSRVSRVSYSFRPTDTVEHVVRTMVAVETLYEQRLATWSLERVVVVDDGTPRKPPAGSFGDDGDPGKSAFGSANGGGPKPPSIRAGTVQVNGRLPPEVIQRIVRQSFGKLRHCYESGLRSNPALQGRVTVKFVIDRTGNVSAAVDGGSDLPDPGVVACVVRAVGTMTFPQPEGGIVTVVYPFVFTPS